MYVDTKHWCRHTLGINNAYVYCIVRYLIYNQLLSAENSVILGSYLLLLTAVQCFFQCCGSESFYVDSDPLILFPIIQIQNEKKNTFLFCLKQVESGNADLSSFKSEPEGISCPRYGDIFFSLPF